MVVEPAAVGTLPEVTQLVDGGVPRAGVDAEGRHGPTP